MSARCGHGELPPYRDNHDAGSRLPRRQPRRGTPTLITSGPSRTTTLRTAGRTSACWSVVTTPGCTAYSMACTAPLEDRLWNWAPASAASCPAPRRHRRSSASGDGRQVAHAEGEDVTAGRSAYDRCPSTSMPPGFLRAEAGSWAATVWVDASFLPLDRAARRHRRRDVRLQVTQIDVGGYLDSAHVCAWPAMCRT
jgi:hypothetical protein